MDNDTQRRETQRAKQIAFGINTDGYKNMMLLVEHDPRLRNGGVLPIPPPPANSSGTKRAWDFLVRRWRRALHMYDHVFIDGVTTERTLEEVIAAQRNEWRSKYYEESHGDDDAAPIRFTDDELFSVQHSTVVPESIPIDSALIHLLRSRDKYDAFAETCMEQMVASASGAAATLAQAASPTTWGLKFVVGPDGSAVCPSVAQAARGAQPSRTGWRSASRSPINSTQPPPIDQSPDKSPEPTLIGLTETEPEVCERNTSQWREGTIPAMVSPATDPRDPVPTSPLSPPSNLHGAMLNAYAQQPAMTLFALNDPPLSQDKRTWRQKHQYQKPSKQPDSNMEQKHAFPPKVMQPTAFRVNAPPFIPKSLQQNPSLGTEEATVRDA